MDEIAYGIIMEELERGDSRISSMASVQGSWVMPLLYISMGRKNSAATTCPSWPAVSTLAVLA